MRVRDEIDEKLGFWRWEGGRGGPGGEKDEREGWLVNMHQVSRLLAHLLVVFRCSQPNGRGWAGKAAARGEVGTRELSWS